MPILHVHVAGNLTDPAGNPVSSRPSFGLAARGPVVQVTVSVAEQVAKELTKQGLEVPGTESGLALLDTGASSTCIDESAAVRMGLPTIDILTMASASHAGAPHNVHPITFEIAGLPLKINALRAAGVELHTQGLLALIGRDVLASCTFHYNGVTGEFTLAL